MILFQQNFKIHPVGQGLFYSGHIITELPNTGRQEYNFVFDCGSKNKANCIDEIEEYQNSVFPENQTLDLLMISHFDEDHVNCIYKLLENRKVKKIIAPFLNFEERLLLVLRWIEQHGLIGTVPETNFTLRLILDPVGTLAPYLDDDEGEIVFIFSNPDNPVITDDGFDSGNFSEEINKGRLSLDFGKGLSNLKPADFDCLKGSNNNKAKRAYDGNSATIKIGTIPIMEFLFYRKEIGTAEHEFYDKVFELFIERFKSKFEDPDKPTIDELAEVIKTIRTATVIKHIFKEAREELSFETFKNTNIADLNTTALCLLHKNKLSFYSYLERFKPTNGYQYRYNSIVKIQKFEGLNSYSKNEYAFDDYLSHRNHDFYIRDKFPNVLLTSDSFLLNEDDSNAFYNKYKNSWQDFWLFQVPHHGSSNNANVHLFSKIPYRTNVFINYGVVKTWGGNWQHPSHQLIADLTATGHSERVIPVNEFTGLRFNLVVKVIEKY